MLHRAASLDKGPSSPLEQQTVQVPRQAPACFSLRSNMSGMPCRLQALLHSRLTCGISTCCELLTFEPRQPLWPSARWHAATAPCIVASTCQPAHRAVTCGSISSGLLVLQGPWPWKASQCWAWSGVRTGTRLYTAALGAAAGVCAGRCSCCGRCPHAWGAPSAALRVCAWCQRACLSCRV